MNDADIEMLELAEQGDMIAKGICPICEDYLSVAKVHATFPWYHHDCYEDLY